MYKKYLYNEYDKIFYNFIHNFKIKYNIITCKSLVNIYIQLYYEFYIRFYNI